MGSALSIITLSRFDLRPIISGADQFAMLRLIEPVHSFHPNISPSGAICIEIYPGETLLEICLSLHDLFRWRICQYDERDALNSIACAGAETISTNRSTIAHCLVERSPSNGNPLKKERNEYGERCDP